MATDAVQIELRSLATEALVAYDDCAESGDEEDGATHHVPAIADGADAAKSGLVGATANMVNVIARLHSFLEWAPPGFQRLDFDSRVLLAKS